MDSILRVEALRVSYYEQERTVRAVDGVDLALAQGQTLALVGESGCGKTSVALAVLDLLPHPGRVVAGRITFAGRELRPLAREQMRRIRGREISMIFQDPVSGLNPVLGIGSQVEEIIRSHLDVSKRQSRQMALEALRQQRLPEPEGVMASYPFQLSGGMCQRVMIAIATVLRPRVIIADEPTSALDVTIQAAILDELRELKERQGVAIILISHDLGVVARMADDVAVMYAGRIVERGAAGEVFSRPRHPYTAALMAARPRVDEAGRPLQVIPGSAPDLAELPGECAFLPRCHKAVSRCRVEPWPPLREIEDGHLAACFNPVFQPKAEAEVAR